MITLTLLGTGNVQGSPVYGCLCDACERARCEPKYRRRLCSAMLQVAGHTLLIDANRSDLCELFAANSISAILLTHYHMDHVQSLFQLRWSKVAPIPVYQPNDDKGCDDLFKHPGILAFQPANEMGREFCLPSLPDLRITALALNHSKPCNGYLFNYSNATLAYLTDTCELPKATWQALHKARPQYIVIDCSFAPGVVDNNHNNLTQVLAMAKALPQSHWLLTHIGHDLDAYLMQHTPSLPDNITIARDEMTLTLAENQDPEAAISKLDGNAI